MNWRKTAVLLFLSVLVLVPVPLLAEFRPSLYTVDMQGVIERSKIGKAAKKEMDAELHERQAKVNGLEQDVKKMRDEIAKQSAVLSGEALDKKRSALEKKERELRDLFAQQQEEIQRKSSAMLQKVVAEIRQTINSVAEKSGYGFVFERDRTFLLFAAKDLDITDEVVSSLDERKDSL